MIQATFAYGADGWGFAMVHDERGVFISTTEVRAEATVRKVAIHNAFDTKFCEQSWTWRIDPQGKGRRLKGVAMRGADGVCTRDGDTRSVRYGMGNSDWWTDGRAKKIIRRGS